MAAMPGPIPLRSQESIESDTTFSLPATTAATDFTVPQYSASASPKQQFHAFPTTTHDHLPHVPPPAEMLPWDTGIKEAPEPPQERSAKRFCNGLFKWRPCRSENSSSSSKSSVSAEAKSVHPSSSNNIIRGDAIKYNTNKMRRCLEEQSKRSLDHFPAPSISFPQPSLEFDFRVAVKLRPESSHLHTRAAAPAPAATEPGHPDPTLKDQQQKKDGNAPNGNAAATTQREITAITTGNWSGSFGHGKVLAGGYDLGQARGFRPIRIVEGVFVMQTTDEVPAILEMRTRGSLSGPCDVLDSLLSPASEPKNIDPRRYGFRMFSTIKTADKRYAEIVNCGLWVASGVWRGDELIIDAYRVT